MKQRRKRKTVGPKLTLGRTRIEYLSSRNLLRGEKGIQYLRASMDKKHKVTTRYNCRGKRVSFDEVCCDRDCPWFLNNEGFLNCTWVACRFGPFTLQEIGTMMGISRERVRQIEVKALKRLQHKKRKEILSDFRIEPIDAPSFK